MIVYGILGQVFGGNKQPAVDIKTINLTENGVEINGTLVDIPTHLSVSAKLLGKPIWITATKTAVTAHTRVWKSNSRSMIDLN